MNFVCCTLITQTWISSILLSPSPSLLSTPSFWGIWNLYMCSFILIHYFLHSLFTWQQLLQFIYIIYLCTIFSSLSLSLFSDFLISTFTLTVKLCNLHFWNPKFQQLYVLQSFSLFLCILCQFIHVFNVHDEAICKSNFHKNSFFPIIIFI